MTNVLFTNPPGVTSPKGYTQVVSAEGLRKILYISGQVSINEKGEPVSKGDLEAQTRQVYSNLLTILKSQGATFKDVVKLNTYCTEPEKIAVVRKVRDEFVVKESPPASTFIGVTALADPAYLIEVEATAIL